MSFPVLRPDTEPDDEREPTKARRTLKLWLIYFVVNALIDTALFCWWYFK